VFCAIGVWFLTAHENGLLQHSRFERSEKGERVYFTLVGLRRIIRPFTTISQVAFTIDHFLPFLTGGNDSFSGHWLKHCDWNIHERAAEIEMWLGAIHSWEQGRTLKLYSIGWKCPTPPVCEYSVRTVKGVKRSLGVCSKHLAKKLFVTCKSIEAV